MKNLKIGFIGAGNMANSLIYGLLNSGYTASNIWASNRHKNKLKHLKKLNIQTTIDNRLIANVVDVIVFAVKPQSLKEIITNLEDLIRKKKPLIISLAVGINLKIIQSYIKHKSIAMIRSMPNTPSLLGCGATGLYSNHHTSSTQKKIAETLFKSVGIVVWCKTEKEIDVVAALSGSGPAYFFLMIEALQDTGRKLGLSQKTTLLLSQQTALGAARMAMNAKGKESIQQLKQSVISRKGITEAALKVLEKENFSESIKSAILAAKQRAKELADEF